MGRPREHDIDSLLERATAIMAQRGVHGLTLRGLAEETGASNGTIHHAFRSRSNLVAMAYLREAEKFLALQLDAVQQARSASDPAAPVVAAALTVSTFAKESPTGAAFLLLVRYDDLLKEKVRDDLRDRLMGRRWVDLITRFRIPALILGLGAAVVMSIPVASMELALPDDGSKSSSTQPRQAFDVIADNFGAGANGPLTVVVDTKGSDDPVGSVAAAVRKVESVKTDVASVVSPLPDPSNPSAVAALTRQLDEAKYATITVTPKSAPADAETKELVHDLQIGRAHV